MWYFFLEDAAGRFTVKAPLEASQRTKPCVVFSVVREEIVVNAEIEAC